MTTGCNKNATTITNKKPSPQKNTLIEILQHPLFKKIEKIILPILEKNSAHDFSHSLRVAKNALLIAQQERGDPETLVAAALLHDIVSIEKNHPDRHKSSSLAAEKSKEILEQIGFPPEKIPATLDAIKCHSFSANLTPQTHDGKIFQDADRLDGLGAIGIARAFATGGRFNSKIYSHKDPLAEHGRSPDDKKYMVDHFFIKLFKLPEKMWTNTGKALARDRILYMQNFLKTLQNEVESL